MTEKIDFTLRFPQLHCSRILLVAAILAFVRFSALAEDQVFSGPQPGEKITPFKAIYVRGPAAGQEASLLNELNGRPIVLLFVHGIERSMAPLMTAIDQYASEKKDLLHAAFVFLSSDRVTSEKQLPAVGQSLRLQSPMTLSLDGAEGPGNYGLNKNCLLTLVVAKENKVVANFALVQPGIADAPKVIEALAKACGDNHPPSVEELRMRRQALTGGPMARARDAATPMASSGAKVNWNKFDLDSEKGLRDAVKSLIAEVQTLRKELDGLRGNKPAATAEKRELPGAAPTDEKLLGMLRGFIQKSNDDSRVDALVKQVEEYVKGNADLAKQAIDGWTRVIYLKYGTDYALKAGQAMVDRLKR